MVRMIEGGSIVMYMTIHLCMALCKGLRAEISTQDWGRVTGEGGVQKVYMYTPAPTFRVVTISL